MDQWSLLFSLSKFQSSDLRECQVDGCTRVMDVWMEIDRCLSCVQCIVLKEYLNQMLREKRGRGERLKMMYQFLVYICFIHIYVYLYIIYATRTKRIMTDTSLLPPPPPIYKALLKDTGSS